MKNRKKIEAIHKAEEEFHDGWAINEAPSDIDVFEANEVCTAPEMRYITKYLGNLDGKSILDIGCGGGLLCEPRAPPWSYCGLLNSDVGDKLIYFMVFQQIHPFKLDF